MKIMPAKAPMYDADDADLKAFKRGWNAMHDEAAAHLAALATELEQVKRERDTYLDNWKEARSYLTIETNHAKDAEARAEKAERERGESAAP